MSSPDDTRRDAADTGAGPRVLVVIPTYNEAENLPELLRRLMALDLPGLEVLLVDDSSPDGTADLAERLSADYGGRVRVLRRPAKMGLGTAYVAGFAEALRAGADLVVEMDADLSHAPEYIPEMVNRMDRYDVVVGSRWTAGGGADPGWGLGRRLLSRGGSLFARLVLRLRVADTTTGFKCFRRQALEQLDLAKIKSQGFAFQVEMAHACQRRGHRVTEIPIRFADRVRGESKMSLRIVLEALWRVLAIRFRRGA
ncbi:MAG: polyprenol monophosphomannose synthase [Dehalococcoidia bacterium]